MESVVVAVLVAVAAAYAVGHFLKARRAAAAARSGCSGCSGCARECPTAKRRD